MSKRVYLYGIANARDEYRIVRYVYIDSEREEITIKNIVTQAAWLKFKNPDIEHVYAVDDSARMASYYKNTKRANNAASNVQFKCVLETEGLKVI